VDAATMLRWYTSGSAALAHDEGTRGSITPGRRADLIVVHPDPLTVAPERLRSVQVRLTMVDGRIVYEG
jgi:predicted amidohydrolase YtcJ